MNGLVYLKNVVTLELDQQKCNGCRMCTIVCPHEVFLISDKKAFINQKDHCIRNFSPLRHSYSQKIV
jgi:Fe-S-cluster-containing hydrogenase component 2